MRPLQKRAGHKSQAAGALLPSQLFFLVELPLLSWPVISCPSFQAHPKHTLPWNHPGLVSLPAGFCLHLSFLVKDPSYSAPSFVHMHTASHSSCGVRSVHQALFWNPSFTVNVGPISQMKKLRNSDHITGLRAVSF